jgi:beta-lactamase class A
MTVVIVVVSALGLTSAEALARRDGSQPPRGYPALRAVGDLGRPLRDPRALVFPGPAAVRAARSYAATRQGRVSFAVGDARGDIAGQAFDRPYPSASLSKAMILVAYLYRAERSGKGVSPLEVSRLDGMIRVSDNYSASWLFRRLGPRALAAIARRAGLRSFSVDGDWGAARLTAADQVRFFLAIDRLLPEPRRRNYARHLLSHIAAFHSWGIPQVARPHGWRVFFKGGSRPDGSGQLVHQAAVLERGPRRIAIAVLTDGSPSEKYGHGTIRGIAERLLGRAARPGVLVPIKSLG